LLWWRALRWRRAVLLSLRLTPAIVGEGQCGTKVHLIVATAGPALVAALER
jgi:hypothetical protein